MGVGADEARQRSRIHLTSLLSADDKLRSRFRLLFKHLKSLRSDQKLLAAMMVALDPIEKASQALSVEHVIASDLNSPTEAESPTADTATTANDSHWGNDYGNSSRFNFFPPPSSERQKPAPPFQPLPEATATNRQPRRSISWQRTSAIDEYSRCVERAIEALESLLLSFWGLDEEEFVEPDRPTWSMASIYAGLRPSASTAAATVGGGTAAAYLPSAYPRHHRAVSLMSGGLPSAQPSLNGSVQKDWTSMRSCSSALRQQLQTRTLSESVDCLKHIRKCIVRSDDEETQFFDSVYDELRDMLPGVESCLLSAIQLCEVKSGGLSLSRTSSETAAAASMEILKKSLSGMSLDEMASGARLPAAATAAIAANTAASSAASAATASQQMEERAWQIFKMTNQRSYDCLVSLAATQSEDGQYASATTAHRKN